MEYVRGPPLEELVARCGDPVGVGPAITLSSDRAAYTNLASQHALDPVAPSSTSSSASTAT